MPQTEMELLTALSSEVESLRENLESYEEICREYKARINGILQKDMPEIMQSLGLEKLETKRMVFSRKLYVSGTFPKQDPELSVAIEELEKTGNESILKNALHVDFPVGSEKLAKEEKERFEIWDIPCSLKKTVHPQTFKSFVRSVIENGEIVDIDKIGADVGEIVVVRKKLTQ